MKKTKQKWLVLSVSTIVGLLVTVARAQAPQGPPVTVKLKDGALRGTVIDSVATFKGVPFAAPPVGANRWRAPQPVKPWMGVRNANTYSAAPMQNHLTAMVSTRNFLVKTSEDCLYLNVWTPARNMSAKLPVMAWIHGGGFNAGVAGAPDFDGADLAKHGVIVVTIAYRLGAFGFLAHPDLARESGHGSGTYGIQDQIAGLHWIKRNISQFGGNPSNVTIFGESAGASSTALLAFSPPARGLFHKVIAQSGPMFAFTARTAQAMSYTSSRAAAEQSSRKLLEALGVRNIAAARKLSADAIQQASEKTQGVKFGPAFDNFVVPEDQYHRFLAKQYNDTPILIGSNSDDGIVFPIPAKAATIKQTARAIFKDKADTILAGYPHATDSQASKAMRSIVRDVVFGLPTWKWAQLQSTYGKSPAYLYYFDRYSPETPEGALHGAEIPYVFGNGISGSQELSFSQKMQKYWTNFAKTGNPNGSQLPRWPAHLNPNGQALVLSNTGISAQAVPNLNQIKALDSLSDK